MHTLDPDSLISVVAPIYNELENVDAFVAETRDAFRQLESPAHWELILVDDGSDDGTAERLDELAREYGDEITVLHLARNFGLEPAVTAGLDIAGGDVVIVMDADMQDDPAAFKAFLDKWSEGYDVVYAIRTDRKENPLQRGLFWFFYRLLSWIARIDLPVDASNFGLMDRRVVENLRALPERNRYIRGLRAWVGFNQTGVKVARRSRYDNRTRLGFRGQWKLAMNAIFSFSYVPLFLFRIIGALAVMLSFALILFALYARLFTNLAVKAWTSQFITISFFSGINIFGLGVLGEYIARIHDEVKRRPNYIVARIEGKHSQSDHAKKNISD